MSDVSTAPAPGGTWPSSWYAPGPAPDFRWTDLDANSGDLEYSTSPLTVNGSYAKPFVGDFDDDDCDDVFWYSPGPGPDYVWYGTPDGGFESHPFTVNGSYTPLVGDWDDGGALNDIFWYAQGGGTEAIWRGGPATGAFLREGAPQVSGVGYRAVSAGLTILFHRPGPGTDYIWAKVFAGDGAPGDSIPVVINGTYEPHFAGGGALLYGPGATPDRFIYSFQEDGSLGVLNGTIGGTYRVATATPSGLSLVVFHAPGAAQDYLWVGPT